MQLLLLAGRHGVRVPGDLSILGCSNNNICGYLTPALTSIEQYPEEIGRQAYELIHRRQQEGEEPGKRKPETIRIAPRLVVRKSCGPPESRASTRMLSSPGILPPAGTPAHTPQATPQDHPELARLLSVCVGEQSKRGLMARLQLRDGKHFSSAYLNPALDAGYLERTIPAKPRSGNQRYRLTAKGQAWVKSEA